MELVDFLRARLDEDEAAATDALSPALQIGRLRGKTVPRWRITESGRGLIDDDGGTLRARDTFPAEAAHVIRHDPARVLAEVEAKRMLLDLHAPGEMEYADGDVCMACDVRGEEPFYPCRTLRLLARAHRTHPDFDPAWLED